MINDNELTRREFVRKAIVVTALSSGFAAAVMPVAAETTIHTDSVGLIAGAVNIPTTDGTIPAYRAKPNSGGPFPIVLVVHEIFGVHEHIQDVCRRIAKHGYLAVAPALYAREGDVSTISDIGAIITQVVSKVPDDQALSDLDATADWAARSDNGDGGRLAITGFCWGGRIVWLYAAHNPYLKAAVAWYGPLVGPVSTIHPENPIDVASRIHVPVLGLYGGQDKNITVTTIAEMRSILTTANAKCDIIVYQDAPHGFHADYRPSYHKADALDGERRMYWWFTDHGM